MADKNDTGTMLAEIFKFLKGKISEDDQAKLEKMLINPDNKLHDDLNGASEQYADDSAGPVRAMQNYRRAETECAAFLKPGSGMAFDSGAAIYRHSLKQMGMDTSGIPKHGLRGVYLAMRQVSSGNNAPRLAADSAASESAREQLRKKFPGISFPKAS